MTALMSLQQVADESGRHYHSVHAAVRRKLLKGTQAYAGARWSITREDFDDWMARGRPIDVPAKAKLRRSA